MSESPSPAPDFTPVPLRARRDGWTAERQRAFIAALRETCRVGEACRRFGVARKGRGARERGRVAPMASANIGTIRAPAVQFFWGDLRFGGVLACAGEDRGKESMAHNVHALTEKEKQTLRLLLAGHDAKSMARKLDLSVHTVNERLRDDYIRVLGL